MFNHRRSFIFMLSLMVISVTSLTGCPPKKNKKEVLRTGRTRLSPTGTRNANGTINSYTSTNPSTLWSMVNGDQNFAQNLYYFTLPSMNGLPADEQLGYVSPTGGNTGFFFWANIAVGANGQIDSARSRIHVEIYDDKYGTARPNGGQPYEAYFYHIGPEQEGFQGVQGNAGQITFTASYGSIMLQGQNQGGTFSGTFMFTNQHTGGWVQLGQFSVPSAGIFTN